jgi:hypothetical protein
VILFALPKSQTVKAAKKFGQMLRLATLRKMNSAVSRPQTAFFADASLALICYQISSMPLPCLTFWVLSKKEVYAMYRNGHKHKLAFKYLFLFCFAHERNGQLCADAFPWFDFIVVTQKGSSLLRIGLPGTDGFRGYSRRRLYPFISLCLRAKRSTLRRAFPRFDF